MSNPDTTVVAVLTRAAARIGGDCPRLDAELLLGSVIQRDRTWFRTWPDRQLDADSILAFERQVDKRVAGHPVAHLLGHQGFWSLSLQVSEHTLIPRPDTECLVEAALELPLPERARVLDLGTGTGAIALALASERSGWQITATDAIDDAVALARRNADALALPVFVEKSHWFEQLSPSRFDLIVSNPPYIAAQDHHLSQGDVRFEPASALVAGADGLDDIRQIVAGAIEWLAPAGWLMVEHGFDQGGAVRCLFETAGFQQIETCRDYGQNDRYTLGRFIGRTPLASRRRRMLTDDELMRYSRQLLLPQLDVQGQLRLKGSRVLVVGAGGLGCPVALYLGGAGIGHLVLADDDVVELANLQRQVAFRQSDIGQPKAYCLAEQVRSMNPDIRIDALTSRLAGDALTDQVQAADLVVDCTDNFSTRFAINRACVAAGVPLVSGAAIRGEGQVSVFDSRLAESPCYQCLYSETGDEDLRCSEAGVIGPLVGLIGACQAMEAIKIITGLGQPLAGRLLLLDAWRMEWREMKLARDPACPVCHA